MNKNPKLSLALDPINPTSGPALEAVPVFLAQGSRGSCVPGVAGEFHRGKGEAESSVFLSFLQTHQPDHLLEGKAGQRPGELLKGRPSNGRWDMSSP